MTQREYATYTFPEDNLLYALVDLYFKEINTYLPLLHKHPCATPRPQRLRRLSGPTRLVSS